MSFAKTPNWVKYRRRRHARLAVEKHLNAADHLSVQECRPASTSSESGTNNSVIVPATAIVTLGPTDDQVVEFMTTGTNDMNDDNVACNSQCGIPVLSSTSVNDAAHICVTANVNVDDSDSECDSSDDVCDEVEASVHVDLCDSLRTWAVSFGITLIALSALLCILRKYHPTLPKDGRTLMKTARAIQIEQKAGGSFYHFGLLTGIKILIDRLHDRFPQKSALNLQLNVDGLPLYKSSLMQFWPVLGLLRLFGRNFIFVVTLFFAE